MPLKNEPYLFAESANVYQIAHIVVSRIHREEAKGDMFQ